MQSVWKGWPIAGAAIFCWLALVAAWWLTTESGQASGLFALIAALVPSTLIGLLAYVIQRLAATREQLDNLALAASSQPRNAGNLTRPEIDAMFQKLTARQQVSDRALLSLLEGRVADRTVLAEVAENSARAASVRTRPAAARPTPIIKSEAGQSSLPLNEPHPEREDETPSWADLVRALNFPQDQDDDAGFRAMHRAMKDRQVAQVLRAAEDVLNLLSQDGIYMDDLNPTAVDPALWRRFAGGERGTVMSGLAAIDDQTALSLTRGRMRSDDVMRDAALHFIRHFDLLLKSLCARMEDDADIARLADTRTGRAFMLLATVAGALE